MSSKRGGPAKAPVASRRVAPRRVPGFLVAVVLALLVLSVYWQTGAFGFVNFDDNRYVSENAQVLKGLAPDSIAWAFTTFHGDNWTPLTWLSHMADVEWFGLDAGWHHRVNVAIHLVSTVLLFLVLRRMTGRMWPSAFAAALFGVHPLHVESVAWIAERRDVLSTLFWMLTLAAYLRYTRRPGVGRYVLVAVSLALGLMCKPMLVTLPFALLLLDWWPLDRMAPADPSAARPPGTRASVALRLVREKIPLLALSAVFCVITYLAQAGSGATSLIRDLPLGTRVSNALVSYVAYLRQTAWPSSLAVFYPHPASVHERIPAWAVAGSIVVLAGLTLVVLRQARRRPFLATGWFWYLGTLVPVIGLIQTGSHAMADRFTYVPLIGIFVALAWGAPSVLPAWRFRPLVLGVCGAAAVLASAAAASKQASCWRDSVTLFSHAVAVTDRNWLALNNLGDAFYRLGQTRQAVGSFEDAVRIRPDYFDGWRNLGVSRKSLGQLPEAIAADREALRIEPGHAETWVSLGNSHFTLGEYRQAVDAYRESLRIRPAQPETWNVVGVSHGMLGEYRQAIECFQQALRIKPDFAGAKENLAIAQGRLDPSR